MPGTTAVPTLLTDPGLLFWAPLSTAIPSGTGGTVASSAFTDSWAGPWVSLGATEDGSEFDYEPTVEAITVAEFLDPIKFVTTGRQGSIGFNLASWTLTNLSRALNGAQLAVVSGSGATQLNRLRLPVPGTETRCMIGWESLDATVRMVGFQLLNAAKLTTAYKKAPAFATIPCEFRFEVPASAIPIEFYSAGAARA